MTTTGTRIGPRGRGTVACVARAQLFGLIGGLGGLGGLVCAVPAAASQTQVHVAEGRDALLKGTFDGAALTPAGQVVVGPAVRTLADGLGGPVLALARGGDGALYAATAAPGRVWRIVEGKPAEKIHEDEKPLITALLPVGKGTLVALTAADGGAVVIDLASKKATAVPTKDAKLLLAGAVLDDVVYAVGGGEQGVVLRLAPGAQAFEVVARTKEPQLRSIAATRGAGGPRLIVGGGEEGVVYEVVGGKVRALLDAAPAEVTSVAVGPDGTVYAAAVDSDGKLSKGATARATDPQQDNAKEKARKVKSSEVWSIDAAGHARVLWQSRDHGAYAIAHVDLSDAAGGKRPALLVGTGPEGRLYHLDPSGGQAAGILARVKDRDEITSLRAEAGGIVLGTAHAPAVLLASTLRAPTGTWTSEVFDAEALTRLGTATSRGRGDIRLSVRSGNTSEADDTWSEWAPSAASAPVGRYAQVRAIVAGNAALDGVALSHLVDNRAPEVARIDVLAPGWKVVAGMAESQESRSVSFGEKPFSRFLDRRGGQHPTGNERTFGGKQTFDLGYRTLYVYAEDPDRDAVRYRFHLGRLSADGRVAEWTVLKEWSDHPFVSFEASRLTDGPYRVKVEVDDLLTNGPTRRLNDVEESATFTVDHTPPRVSGAAATRGPANTVRVRFEVQASLPLTAVRCSAGAAEWVPVDAKDGMVDTAAESFDVVLELGAASGALRAVSCEAYDEALSLTRVDIPVGG